MILSVTYGKIGRSRYLSSASEPDSDTSGISMPIRGITVCINNACESYKHETGDRANRSPRS